MARRATLFERLKETQARRTLFLAGPYEFLPDFGESSPGTQTLAALAKAYELLGYSAGYLTPEESQKLGPGKPGPNWQTVDKDVVSRVVEVRGEKIGIIFFPSIKKDDKAPSEDLRGKINREAAKLRPQVRLVIGVSPWGRIAEGEYLSSKPGIDVLCGAGPGDGLKFQPAIDGRVLWGRAYTRGRAVNSFDVLAWPTDDKGFVWKENENFETGVLTLDENNPENLKMAELFKDIPDEAPAAGNLRPAK